MQSWTMDKRLIKNKCILVAGMPWSGKTTFVSELEKRYKDFSIISIDKIQEYYYDTIWFSNLEEKKELHKKAFETALKHAKNDIKNGKIPVLEYPFDNRHKKELEQTFENVDILTIRLDLPVEKAYKHFHERDLSGNRHPWHFHQSYPIIWDSLPQYQSFEDYAEAMKHLDVANFSLWTLLKIDTSVFPLAIENVLKYLDDKF